MLAVAFNFSIIRAEWFPQAAAKCNWLRYFLNRMADRKLLDIFFQDASSFKQYNLFFFASQMVNQRSSYKQYKGRKNKVFSLSPAVCDDALRICGNHLSKTKESE